MTIGDTALKRGLPTNIDAEQMVLGVILLDNSIYSDAAARLKPDDFAITKHQTIFRRFADLQRAGRSIEALTLVEELEKRGELDSVDGIAGVAALTDGMPRLSSIDSYIEIVKEKSMRRQLIAMANHVANQSMEGTATLDEIMAGNHDRLIELADSSTGGPRAVRTAAEKFPGGVTVLLDPSQKPEGIKTPWADYNGLTVGLHRGELTIIAARPAMGKTALALNLAAYAASQGHKVAFFSLEMSEPSLLMRLLVSETRVDGQKHRRGKLDPEERHRMSAALTRIYQWPLCIDDKADTNVMEISAKCRRMRDLNLAVVDYLQLIGTTGGRRNDTRATEVGHISRGLKLLARDMGIPVVALCQLNRKPEEHGGRRPQLSDLRDSGSIEQDADVVAMIYREGVYKPDRDDLKGVAELIIAKQRNGPTGTVKLAWVENCMRFETLAEGME